MTLHSNSITLLSLLQSFDLVFLMSFRQISPCCGYRLVMPLRFQFWQSKLVSTIKRAELSPSSCCFAMALSVTPPCATEQNQRQMHLKVSQVILMLFPLNNLKQVPEVIVLVTQLNIQTSSHRINILMICFQG